MMQIQRVLMVDDDQAIRRITEITLDRVGKWEVLAVESGARALAELATFRPDVILLDVMMPEMDGPTTFEHLRRDSSLAHVPVIFMTAKVQRHEMDGYHRLGAAGVIMKPFDPLQLVAEIQKIVTDGQQSQRIA